MTELKFIAALIILVGLKNLFTNIPSFRQMSVEQCPIICFTAANSYAIEFFCFSLSKKKFCFLFLFFFVCVELMVFISVSVYIFHTTASILHNNINMIL